MSTLGDQSVEIAQRRRTDPIRLAQALKGDLDWITMKAMEKDRTRRYGSLDELAADIDGCLADEPVLACPPGVGPKARKSIRRNKVSAAVAALAFLALIGSGGAMSWQARRIALERSGAEGVSDFLFRLFLAPDPSDARGRVVGAGELLDRGAAQLEAETSGDPMLRARTMNMLGRTYEGLRLYETAAQVLERGLVIQQEQAGTNHQGTIATMHDLALVC